ncbi:MAG: peptidoglycan-binding protein [Candidatus Sungbacteria bacterium]|uniref:Peptidoglycan-binding protein n=1 Tax=Candidatus Sungiibacteriota bacterium TaxID=2750080 RepID=A0A932YW92_9BACT|nr:peptidoglycan-binding protein [Candidatus Sungbacteria bacterium]
MILHLPPLKVTAIGIVAFALAVPASADGPELHISAKGEVQIIGAELITINAINLFSVNVWGQRWVVPIDKWATLESADGKPLAAVDILQGHRLEIKGRADPNRGGWLDTRLIRDLSIGTPPPPVITTPAAETANIGAALPPTPLPAPLTSPVPVAPPPAPPPASSKRLLTQQLRAGMRGGEVVILQEFLQKNNWGIPNDGPVTGYYGKVTANAVKKFQAANGLAPEGEVGPKTRELINRWLAQP